MAEKKSNKRINFGIAAAFLLPLSLYLIVSYLSKGKVQIPNYFNIERIDTTKTATGIKLDTVYHKVADITLMNQVGETVSLNQKLKGKILVMDFIFTDCTESCPMLTKKMSFLQKGFGKDPKKEATLVNDVHFISISVMPERDSLLKLRAYADRFGANPDHWWFMTGDKKSIYKYIREELGLSTGPGDGGADDLIHTEKLVLLDTFRNIRGIYEGANDKEVKNCADDIVLLTLEKHHK